MNILIDTNVLIGLEDAGIIEERFADLSRTCAKHATRLFVHEASLRDVARDADTDRRASTRSRFSKFPKIKSPRGVTIEDLANRFGLIRKENDEVDALLLDALQRNAADILITEDQGIHRRARDCALADRVFTSQEAIVWLRGLFEPETVSLPEVQDVEAYEINFDDPIFEELSNDYPNFGVWATKCKREHRPCWIMYEGDEIAGLVIRKEEKHSEANTRHAGPKILKLCTFKVAAASRGRKLGEQLLKQALWHAQRNDYDLVYLTVYPKQERLIWLLEDYGFQYTSTRTNGEMVYEKPLGHGPVVLQPNENALGAAFRTYPRFYDGAEVGKFAIPIRPIYHRILFPELSSVPIESAETPGNTIRKVYLTHSKSTRIRPGDLIFFYLSQGNHPDSQSITSVGVVTTVTRTSDANELARLTARRSAYPDVELQEFVAGERNVMVIDFLLVGHLEVPITLGALTASGILNGPPQSVTRINGYATLKSVMDLGFDV